MYPLCLKPSGRVSFFVTLVAATFLCCDGYSSSQTNKTPQSANKAATLVVDTDDTCHFFIDDEDKGRITPDTSQKFAVGLGEHILKCTIEGIPDIVWRKVVNAKDSSQIAAAISLKALHIQYDQALEKAKNAQEAASENARKQLAEAEAEEKERATAKAEFPKQIFDMVKGTWSNSHLLGSYTAVQTTLTFQDLDVSRGVLTFSYEWTAHTYVPDLFMVHKAVSGRRYSGYFTPSVPNRLDATSLECSESDKKASKKGEIKYIPCTGNNAFSAVISVVSKTQLKLLMGTEELILVHAAQ